ncbi:glycosyltransferase family 4 protein [Caproicibacterium sp. NSD3]
MRVLLFSNFELPNSCANATRVFAFAKILKELQIDVSLVGIAYNQNIELNGNYNSIEYRMLRASNYSGIKAIKRIDDLRKSIRVFLNNEFRNCRFDAIILSNIYFNYSKIFLDFSNKNQVPLIVNAVEWYDANNELFCGLFGKLRFIQNRIALKYIHVRMKNIIAISTFLGDYYQARNCNVIVVPTILDIAEYQHLSHIENKKIIISYAGVPAKKDYIKNVVLSLQFLTKQEINKIEIHFYGAIRQNFVNLGINQEYLSNYQSTIFCHGKIPYEEVKNKIAASDFTILLRPDERYANAGFPTKVGESMACSTPVIANYTSDLKKYIIDSDTGVVCRNESPKECAAAIRKILNFSKHKRELMRENAYNMAARAFDYRSYKEVMSKFIDIIV